MHECPGRLAELDSVQLDDVHRRHGVIQRCEIERDRGSEPIADLGKSVAGLGPHPSESQFPCHDGPWSVDLEVQVRGTHELASTE
jgi:hypothetical protein